MKYIIPLISLLAVAPAISARSIATPRSEADYAARIADQPSLAPDMVIPDSLAPAEAEALRFLYAYMPTPDVADYPCEFFIDNIRASLRADREMSWASSVPDREWRHFVLPIRVNNENLDNSRSLFYDELAPRIAGLSMTDAALEVNHWCHEKVTYQPSDARTSSPLATVANALGRCGEESTFTVAALRSVGIPARQVYTPRWAHTDDNHAWVEVWTDGRWHFLGASEPEPMLDLAWFNEPAARGMMMNTTVTGAYDGPEEQLGSTAINTRINVTQNYAPVRTVSVLVTDPDGLPVPDADVAFSLYNYAEFYPIARKTTDAHGRADLVAGFGDLIVIASDGTRFNLMKAPAECDSISISIPLSLDESYRGAFDFDLVPPAPGGNVPDPGEDARLLNDRRKLHEDSIRLAYTATFPDPQRAAALCDSLGLPPSAAPLIVKSRGNHRNIIDFLRNASPRQRSLAVELLLSVNEKDLHDITPADLADHIAGYIAPENPALSPYVINPRIELEMISPYRLKLASLFSDEEKTAFRENPRLLEKKMAEEIKIDSKYNPGGLRQLPVSVWRTLTTDPRSRSIAFVATCRSLGIPARINPVNGDTQFADPSGQWHDVTFGESGQAGPSSPKSILKIDHRSGDTRRTPRYFADFTISDLRSGLPSLLEFGEFQSADSINAEHHELANGPYLLVTGQRLADGAVLAHAEIFGLGKSTDTDPRLTVRRDSTAIDVIGSLDAELTYRPLDSEAAPLSILSTTGRGYYILGLIRPGHEPSSHALNDIALAAEGLRETGRTILLLFPDREAADAFRLNEYGNLPENVVFGIDEGARIATALRQGLELNDDKWPTFVIADTFNRIVFLRRGYTIHLGDLLLDTLHRL